MSCVILKYINDAYLECVVERVHPHSLAFVTLESPEGSFSRRYTALSSSSSRWSAAAASFHPLWAPFAPAAVALVAHL